MQKRNMNDKAKKLLEDYSRERKHQEEMAAEAFEYVKDALARNDNEVDVSSENVFVVYHDSASVMNDKASCQVYRAYIGGGKNLGKVLLDTEYNDAMEFDEVTAYEAMEIAVSVAVSAGEVDPDWDMPKRTCKIDPELAAKVRKAMEGAK